ncbi:hypothetical protein BH09MYX1_BH09MYX1_39270 [soil metagenome]
MSEVDKIIDMLEDESIEKRIAAAIVLSELKVRKPEAQDGFLKLLHSEIPVLQRHGLEALTRIGAAKKALKTTFPLLTSSVADVKRAAAAAVKSVGEEVVPMIRARIGEATPEERRILDSILAELGGKDAFSTLLGSLASSEGEAAKSAALAVRQHVKDAGARDRKSYRAATEKFLESQAKSKSNPTGGSQSAITSAIKILGYLEDDEALPALLAYATAKDATPAVKQEALIAMRFALGDAKGSTKVINVLIDAAESTDRSLAHTALHTLGSLEVPSSAMARFEKLLAHPDIERARFAASYLAGQKSPAAVDALIRVVTTSPERRRSELVAELLATREDAAPALAEALLETTDPDRAWMLRKIVAPMAKKLAPKVRKELLETGLKRLEKAERNWEPMLDIVQAADPETHADALRTLAQKLRRATNDDKAATVLGLLVRSEKATDADRFGLAVIELKKSKKDTRPAIRNGDGALHRLSGLLGRGFDVASSLKKERSLELDDLYYVGFHFAELGSGAGGVSARAGDVGGDLLSYVVDKGGRTKIAKAAKNKLGLSET